MGELGTDAGKGNGGPPPCPPAAGQRLAQAPGRKLGRSVLCFGRKSAGSGVSVGGKALRH